jgi:hypothetical protein
MNPWMQTAGGLAFDYLHPQPEQISIEDIAISLSQTNRYMGHTKFPYSVAQHSVLCAAVVRRVVENRSDLVRCALLHDAHETYVGDIVAPLKRLLPDYRAIENRIASVVRKRFGLPEEMPTTVKTVDLRMLMTEARALCVWPPPQGWGVNYRPFDDVEIERWQPQRTEEIFLEFYDELFDSR